MTHGTLTFRPARKDDHEFLRTLHHRAYRDVVQRQFGAWNEAEQDRWFERGLADGVYQIVEEDGRAVGAIDVRVERDELLLYEMQVAPEHQNRGIGSAILQAQFARARAHGQSIRLNVLKQNRARALYERNGFRTVSETDIHFTMRLPAPGEPSAG